MPDAPHVVAVAGSLRDESTTRMALDRVLAAATAGASTRLVDLREFDLPVYDPDAPAPADADALAAAIDEADAVVLGTPVYHGSFSGALKNALDYVGRDEFAETTVGLLATAGGSFPRPTLEHLRAVSRNLNAWTLPHQVVVPNASNQFDADGHFVDEALAERVEKLGTEAVRYAGLERYPERPERAAPAVGDD